ncbi:LysR family transcriptional regulator [Actinoallomurus liliacearum]|uniref:LysR family transcriptional regulator n=1 Tax=Actinoallomurus liliacearum TaxID=1080073 RepID=A0ABP8TSL6_9ACTN
MEPDLQGMRAFVLLADELHFGRAAARLFLTQQALSKRIRRLENALAVPLFDRTTRRVELTPAGRRFLPLARDAVAAYDTAVAAVRETAAPLRVEVFAERFTPLRVLREAAGRTPGLRVEPTMRQGLATALPAVRTGELDAAFGRVHDVGGFWPADLDHRPVHLEPLHAFVDEAHPLADRPVLRLPDLRTAGIAMPDPGGAEEWRGYLSRLRDELGVPVRFTEPAIGVRDYGKQMRRERRAVMLSEAGTDLEDPRMRRIPIIEPVVMHLWSVTWRRENRDPRLRRLLAALPVPSIPDPGDHRVWIPEVDRAALA